MKFTGRIVLGVLLLSGQAPPVLADSSSDKVAFWQSESQRELWWCAAGTVGSAQLYQYFGMERTPALAFSALQVMGVALGQIYLRSERIGAGALAKDSLGVLIGTLVNVQIRFDYLHRGVKKNPDVEVIPVTP